MTTEPTTASHEPQEDSEGLAIVCSCGSWAILHRNSLGKDAAEAFREHQTRAASNERG